MNMHVKSMDDELSSKTIEFIKRIKTSRGTLTFDHIETLISDYKHLGEKNFLEKARTVLAPARAQPTPVKKDEVLKRLEKTQRRAALKSRDFVDAALENAKGILLSLPKLAAKDRTLPKLLAHFRAHASEDELFRIAQMIIEKHSRTH
jgi:hypothetical protein